MNSIKAIFLSLLMFAFISCERDELGPCSNVSPPCGCTQFTLIDSNGVSLIGEDRSFHPDTLENLNSPEDFYFHNSRDTVITLYFHYTNSGEDIYFKLSQSHMDTLNLVFSEHEGKCFPIVEIEEFRYNNRLITLDDKLYVIEKE